MPEDDESNINVAAHDFKHIASFCSQLSNLRKAQ